MTLQKKSELIKSALSKGELCVVVGECQVKYEGRAISKLSAGDRLLVIKPDGTFLVHQGKGMKAVNYQGPGAKILVSDGDELCVTALRSKPIKEKIEVCFSRVDSVHSFPMRDDKELKLFGSERELSNLLAQDLSVIEKGLKPLKKESVMRKGSIDILAEDSNKCLVVIEVKRRNAGLAAVTQLKRYVNELRKRKGCEVRGFLVAPHVTPNAYAMLCNDGFQFFKLDYEVHNPGSTIKGLQKKQKELGEYGD
ncbi:endonuclease NucS [Candidatus Micrarchaeota archaeon CG_4_10_14_0_2_um_filter_55_9]|nr:MAG: hypothetical protein AUJ15_01180 [Candidatus Micrarchaeota archaeon CG1_02_55_41]PIO03057.1 MAG: endonuclease NucS [Candidatus Micrarchaeota archaeon CG09_land_8_20_14_0_10_55_25]PIZ91755.1 MAG: endonuclease NucS [Candidatus Micrarchaeota archaeon CG_4_10_14_0_2_um_filter_55_9]